MSIVPNVDSHTASPFQDAWHIATDPKRDIARKAQIVVLGPESAEDFLELQKRVIRTLPAGKGYFLRQRSIEYFQEHVMIGIRTRQGQLIGGALLTQPADVDGYPVDADKVKTTILLQSVMIHPDYKKCGLSSRLLGKVLAEAARMGAPHVLARVAMDNIGSMKCFTKGGYAQSSFAHERPNSAYVAGGSEPKTFTAVYFTNSAPQPQMKNVTKPALKFS